MARIMRFPHDPGQPASMQAPFLQANQMLLLYPPNPKYKLSILGQDRCVASFVSENVHSARAGSMSATAGSGQLQ